MDEEIFQNIRQTNELAKQMVNVRGQGRKNIIRTLMEQGVSYPEAGEAVENAIKENLKRCRTTARTDVERFRHATQMLRREKIILLERCHHDPDLGNERATAIAEREEMEGYAYFTEIDLAGCLQSNMMPLSFSINLGLFDEQKEIAEGEREVGEKVTSALRRSGLRCSWSGRVEDHIVVHMQWYERWQEEKTNPVVQNTIWIANQGERNESRS